MKARIKVYRQMLRQCQMIMSGKDFDAALVAAEEARIYVRKIAEIEERNKQPELFSGTDEDEPSHLKVAED